MSNPVPLISSDTNNPILSDSIPKILFHLALPLIIGNLLQTLYNLADAFWVTQISYQAFAAVNFTSPISFLFISLSIGMSTACASLIGQSIGQNNSDKANQLISQFFLISLLSGIILTLLGIIVSPAILQLMGAEGSFYTMSLDYLQTLFLQLPFLFLYYVYRAMLQGQGDTKSPMLLLAVSLILNVLLDPFFIFTLQMGVKGAAVATVLSRLAVVPYAIYRLFNSQKAVHISLSQFRFNRPVIKNLISVGVPGSLGQAFASIGFIVMNSFIIDYGQETIAAFSIGNRITSLMMMPALGIGGALATFVGQNIGADQIERTQRGVRIGISLSFLFILGLNVIIFFFKEPIVRLFIHDSETVVRLSLDYLFILLFSLPLMAIFQGLLGTFQGSGHTRYVLLLSASRLWLIRIPLIIFFQKMTTFGSDGIWYAMLISNIVIVSVGLWLLRYGDWQKRTLTF